MNLIKNQPFKGYTTMNIPAAYNLSCPDLYRFFILSLTTDRNLKTDTTLEQLANFVGESRRNYDSGQRSTALTERLEESGEVSLEYIRSKSLKQDKEVKRIIYTFKEPIPTKYRRISRDFIELDLPIKIKGYLLKLFALADPHSYKVNYSANGIAKEFKMAKATVTKYNNQLVENGFLSLNGSGYELHIESFLLDMPKNQSVETELMIQKVENVINLMKSSDIPLPKSYIQYLTAKRDNFSKIRNMENFMNYVVTGVPFKGKQENTTEIYL